jgi:hypothetical protein
LKEHWRGFLLQNRPKKSRKSKISRNRKSPAIRLGLLLTRALVLRDNQVTHQERRFTMPSINWVYLCDYAYLDAAGKMSVIGMFEFIKAPQLPLSWPQIYVAVYLTASEGEEFRLKVLITSPSKKEIRKIEVQAKGVSAIPGSIGKAANIFLPIGFYNLKFSETGEYHIEIFVDDTPIHSISLNIIPTD